MCKGVYSVFGDSRYNWQSCALFSQWRENLSQTISVQEETTTVNIYDIIFVLLSYPRIIGHSIMKLIKNRPEWVGEAVSSFRDSRRKKTFYR